MPLSHRISYNTTEDIVELDLSNLTFTHEVLDNLEYQLATTAGKLDHKTYALVHWENTALPIELADYYGEVSAKSSSYYLALVRYGIIDLLASTIVRSQVVRRGVQGSRSHIYHSREEALAAINKMRATIVQMPEVSTTSKTNRAPETVMVKDWITFYESPFVTISWNVKLNCVQTVWTGFVEGENYHTGLNKHLELIQSKHAEICLVDARKSGVITSDDQAWFAADWFPRAKKSNLRKLAMLLPERAIAKMSFNRLMQQAKVTENVEIGYFAEPEKAYEWLQISAS